MKTSRKLFVLLLLVALAAGLLSCLTSEGEYVEPVSPADEDVSPPPSEEADTAPAATGEKAKKSEMSADIASEESLSESASPAMADAESRVRPRGAAASRRQASGLKAGFADDNKQFNYFVQFLEQYGPRVSRIPIAIEERIVVKVRDSRGKSIPNARVEVSGPDGRILVRGTTYADGSYLLFPQEHGSQGSYDVAVTYNQESQRLALDRFGVREAQVTFPAPRSQMSNIPLDLLFVLDTTGSMGEEIQRLKTTIELINLNLSSLSTRPRVRFGMVLYKDRGDEYVTEVVPFTEDLQAFQAALEQVEASGGGDTPEDLQAALQDALRMSWNRRGVRLSFIITDAPPHLDYGQDYTYAQAARDAKEKGIKIFGVGTGGLDLLGEVVLRQIAQYTSAKYIFLTYGERGESEGGAPGSVSHHTGANYQTDKLEAIIIRFAKEELSHISDQPIEEEQEYFTADKIDEEAREDTLHKLFSMAIGQLIDYSSVRIQTGTAAAVLPLSPAQARLALNSEYFTEQLVLSFGRETAFRDLFRIVERQDLQKVLEELEIQLSDLSDEQGAAQVGKLIGAELLITGTLYSRAGGYELFLKLVRVQTGEVLSVTKAVIDTALGLES